MIKTGGGGAWSVLPRNVNVRLPCWSIKTNSLIGS